MVTYKFGTYDDTVEGLEFLTIHTAECDSDAQAELTVRQIGEDEEFDLTDMMGEPLRGLYLIRGDAGWFVKF